MDRLHWFSNEVYAEVFALAQCMPGPSSTQVSFAAGILKKVRACRAHAAVA